MIPSPAGRTNLWTLYVRESQVQLRELGKLIATLGQAPWDQEALLEIQRLFHNFSGSGATYAAPQVSALGSEGEFICANVVMAGRAIKESELEGVESVFTRLKTEFEHIKSTAEREAAAQPKPSKAMPLLYLLAPPSPAAAELQAALGQKGLQVELFTSLAEAEENLEKGLPNLAAASVFLPDGSGFDFVRSLRALEPNPSIPVLLMGEAKHFLDKVEAIHCGADGFVPDPPDAATIFKKFKALLARRKTKAARVLAVEDDPSQARYLEETLTSAGYLVRVCQDAAQFDVELHSFHPQAVLMDVLFPGGVSGYDLVKFMRQEEGFAAVPVIFITTEGQRQSQLLAAEAGGDDFLSKPVSAQDLLATVKARLARFRSLQDLMDHDELTGLLSHTPFLKEARLCLNRFSRRKTPYAMVLFQLDGLAELHGHGPRAQDSVLQALAQFLQRKLRQTDVMGRYGDHQLAVVLEHLEPRDAVVLMRRLQNEFASQEISIGPGKTYHATFSTGIAMTKPEVKTLKDWIEQSYSALRDAVGRGGNQTAMFGGEPHGTGSR